MIKAKHLIIDEANYILMPYETTALFRLFDYFIEFSKKNNRQVTIRPIVSHNIIEDNKKCLLLQLSGHIFSFSFYKDAIDFINQEQAEP